ncbi:MAG TPA: hypothetical protein VK324_04510 [Tepidisphaeraceae bacterium]|nr:hypothetical protein [Tepidisphaeraceae bacterium]
MPHGNDGTGETARETLDLCPPRCLLYDAMGGGTWREVTPEKAAYYHRRFDEDPQFYEGWKVVKING